MIIGGSGVVIICGLHKAAVKNKNHTEKKAISKKKVYFSNLTYANVFVRCLATSKLIKLCVRTILVFYYIFKVRMCLTTRGNNMASS